MEKAAWSIDCILFFLLLLTNGSNGQRPPHIIVIMADDLGWNDVSYHGSNEIPTPNIDALAYNGVILNNHHVQPLCTPSRSAFLTGKYPYHMGMQHSGLRQPEPRGLPLNETLLPQHLKKLGYRTHIIGKWHLGFFRSEYTPTQRGFDSHFGYWNDFQDYFDHTVSAATIPGMIGYDMRRNMNVDRNAAGKYSTELYTKEAVDIISAHNISTPLYIYLAHLAVHTANVRDMWQAPKDEIAKFSYINHPERRIYAAMVSIMDKGIGEIVSALESRGMMENSIILFLSDNGAPEDGQFPNRGSNYPLRGQKDSPWEGGSRGVAVVWSPLFNKLNYVSNELIHITDWLPTFWSAAGQDINELGKIDGIDMWNTLKNNLSSPRNEIVVNIDSLVPYLAITRGEWKYINGSTCNGQFDFHFAKPDDSSMFYNSSTVLLSLAAISFEKFYEKQNKSNPDKFKDNHQMTNISIFTLRKEATLDCNNKEHAKGVLCDPLKAPCLFNVKEDPCEYENLAAINITILKSMQDLATHYEETSEPPTNIGVDPSAHPKYFGNVWASWKDDNVSYASIDDNVE